MGERRNLKTLLVIAVIFLGFQFASASGVVIYVDENADGACDGSSWEDAYNFLQDALAAAQSGDQIWVADGIYKPDEDEGGNVTPGSRYETFQLINGVAIYGGYAGYGAPDPNERDPNIYETILSGDLDGNDVDVNDPCDLMTEPTRAENSYHVVTGSGTDATAVLDGLTVTGGNANGSKPHNRGGGMYNWGGSPTVINCTFSANSASFRGGGMFSDGYDSPTVCSPTIITCTFRGNYSARSGGGMNNNEDSSPTVSNCTFSGNSASKGGGMHNEEYSNSTVTNCIFLGNSAGLLGGGMHNDEDASPMVTNCTFSGNSAGVYGGGISNGEDSSPTFTNCTFTENSARRGGGMYCDESNPTLTNCVFWANLTRQILLNDSTAFITYSDVQGGWDGEGNIDEDPLFVDPNGPDDIIGTEDDNLRLQSGSPCIDAGDNNSVPADVNDLDGDGNTTEPLPWDLDGNARIMDGNDDGNPVVDMGAYEYQVVVPPMIEVAMKFTPQALNLRSKGKWLKAHLVLPEGFLPEDVDINIPVVLEPLGIESDYMNVFINEDSLVEIEATFSRGDFCGSAATDGTIDVIVIGLLTSGQNFFGTDTIKIVNKNLEHLAVLASYWLQADCSKPKWCSGLDLNQDSMVNLVDFAMFDGCCIEVIKK